VQPHSVLDIGAGYGKWGFLTREMLDWNAGRLERASWHVRIDGIELFPYASPLHAWVYDNFRHSDVLEIRDELRGYSLVIMSDVIEHLPKRAALALVRMFAATNRNILISTPVDYFDQEIAGNPHEHHVSHWSIRDFDEFVFDADVAGGAALVVLIAGNGAEQPTVWDRRVSRILERTPVVGRRGAVARAIKKPITDALSRKWPRCGKPPEPPRWNRSPARGGARTRAFRGHDPLLVSHGEPDHQHR
jgi:hypothetical protein